MKTIQTRIALALVTTTATLALPAMADVDNRAPQHIGVSAGTVLGALLGRRHLRQLYWAGSNPRSKTRLHHALAGSYRTATGDCDALKRGGRN